MTIDSDSPPSDGTDAGRANLPRLSVIIPNWNGLKHLDTCLSALRRQTERSIEVIVADNASNDGSQVFIAAHYPEVIMLTLPTNRGFTGACNAGLRAAHGAIMVLLNNDTEVDPNWAAEVTLDPVADHTSTVPR